MHCGLSFRANNQDTSCTTIVEVKFRFIILDAH
jgi:hypothetical protein